MASVVLSIYNFESRVKDKDQAKFEAEDITGEVLEYDSKIMPNVANIEMTPNDAKNNGKDWKFVVNYDVKRPADGNDVQIGAGKFVHYFSADNLPTMPKHIIFVLDIRSFHVVLENNYVQYLQINLCQKLLFLHGLTHNMTTDCSWELP